MTKDELAVLLRGSGVPLDPPEHGQTVWAEYDPKTQKVYVGQWALACCSTCGQTDRQEHSLIPPAGFDDHNWQHQCGAWWTPETLSVTFASERDESALAKAITALRAMVEAKREEAWKEVRAALRAQLRDFLSLPPEEREEEAGDASTPGVYYDGQWLAWDHDPAGVDELGVTVYEDELEVDATRERRMNLSARFLPADNDGGLPCLNVAGVQVYGYVKSGVFHVSVDLETAERWLQRDGTVPLEITVSGTTVFSGW